MVELELYLIKVPFTCMINSTKAKTWILWRNDFYLHLLLRCASPLGDKLKKKSLFAALTQLPIVIREAFHQAAVECPTPTRFDHTSPSYLPRM